MDWALLGGGPGCDPRPPAWQHPWPILWCCSLQKTARATHSNTAAAVHWLVGVAHHMAPAIYSRLAPHCCTKPTRSPPQAQLHTHITRLPHPAEGEGNLHAHGHSRLGFEDSECCCCCLVACVDTHMCVCVDMHHFPVDVDFCCCCYYYFTT